VSLFILTYRMASLIIQHPAEHLQAFAWRVWNKLELTKDNVSEKDVLPQVLLGLHPSLVPYLPFPNPSTLDDLFLFAETVPQLIPNDDPYWGTADPSVDASLTPPSIQVTIENEYVPDISNSSVMCYRCRKPGHFAVECKAPRVKDKSIRKKTSKAKSQYKYRYRKSNACRNGNK
jgi:hypothetical protein